MPWAVQSRRLVAASLLIAATPSLAAPTAVVNAGALASGGVARAKADEPMPVPVALQLPLILKILTYDRNLQSRAGSELRIGIVVAPGEAGLARAEIAEGFQRLADRTVKGLRLRVTTLEYGSEAQLEGALRAEQVAVMYVAPGNGAHLDALVRMAREQSIVTTTGVPGYVAQGIAVGIGVQQDRPQILINLAASRAVGSEFDASLLRIVKIVR